MIQRELLQFGKLVQVLHIAGIEEGLVDKALIVATAIAKLQALRDETVKESPWRLSKRRKLEEEVEAALPAYVREWGTWLRQEPLLMILGTPCPVIGPLGPVRLPSKQQTAMMEAQQAYLDERRTEEI